MLLSILFTKLSQVFKTISGVGDSSRKSSQQATTPRKRSPIYQPNPLSLSFTSNPSMYTVNRIGGQTGSLLCTIQCTKGVGSCLCSCRQKYLHAQKCFFREMCLYRNVYQQKCFFREMFLYRNVDRNVFRQKCLQIKMFIYRNIYRQKCVSIEMFID